MRALKRVTADERPASPICKPSMNKAKWSNQSPIPVMEVATRMNILRKEKPKEKTRKKQIEKSLQPPLHLSQLHFSSNRLRNWHYQRKRKQSRVNGDRMSKSLDTQSTFTDFFLCFFPGFFGSPSSNDIRENLQMKRLSETRERFVQEKQHFRGPLLTFFVSFGSSSPESLFFPLFLSVFLDWPRSILIFLGW